MYQTYGLKIQTHKWVCSWDSLFYSVSGGNRSLWFLLHPSRDILSVCESKCMYIRTEIVSIFFHLCSFCFTHIIQFYIMDSQPCLQTRVPWGELLRKKVLGSHSQGFWFNGSGRVRQASILLRKLPSVTQMHLENWTLLLCTPLCHLHFSKLTHLEACSISIYREQPILFPQLHLVLAYGKAPFYL